MGLVAHDAPEPAGEGGGIGQGRQPEPGGDEGLLDDVLGVLEVAQRGTARSRRPCAGSAG